MHVITDNIGCLVTGVLTTLPSPSVADAPATLGDGGVSAYAAPAAPTVEDSVRTSAIRAWAARVRRRGAFGDVASVLFMVVALLLGR